MKVKLAMNDENIFLTILTEILHGTRTVFTNSSAKFMSESYFEHRMCALVSNLSLNHSR